MNRLNIKQLKGMQTFMIIWFGQFVSLMGTAMTRFALMIWAYEQSGKASTTALLGFSSVLPYVLLSPFAGALVDRMDRKKIMILSDLGAGLVTAFMMILFITGNLRVWHIYIAEALSGACGAFQDPAYSSAITMLITKDKFSQASGMRSFSRWASDILAPILGGFLAIQIGIGSVMIIDIITFLAAMLTLGIVVIPPPTVKGETLKKHNSLWSDIVLGLNYITRRKGLLKLLIIFACMNLLSGITYFGILPAMILSRTGNNQMVLAGIQSALGIGGVIGSLVVSLWRGSTNRAATIVVGGALSYLLGDIFLAIGSSEYVWTAAAFLSSFFIPFIMGAESSIWQSKVEPDVQGRVFSIKCMLQSGIMPVGYILGGVLADYVFEPAMAVSGSLSKIFGWITGTGSGSGMALMFLCTGILGVIVSISGILIKDVRRMEEELPDFDTKTAEGF